VQHQLFIGNSDGIEHLLCWTSVQFSMILYGLDPLPYTSFVFDGNSYGFRCIITIIIIIIIMVIIIIIIIIIIMIVIMIIIVIIIIIIIIIIIMLCPRSASVPGNK
jgi:hypothetical protein